MDHISIILVHFNAEAETKECLHSLKNIKTKGFSFEVLVVDNGSKDPLTLEESEQFSQLEVIRSEANLGFTGGNNLGLRYALDKYNSDYVVLLNNDTTVDPNFLQHLYEYSQAHPEAGLINPKIYFSPQREFHAGSYTSEERGNVLWFAGGTVDWTDIVSFHRGVDEVDRGQFDTPTLSDFATGCCLFIKRQVIETVGPLSEDLFLYWEDVDYSLRAQQNGFVCHYCPKAVIWHKNAGSSDGSGSNLHRYYQTRNRLFLGFSYGSWLTKITTLRIAWQHLSHGPAEQKAILDVILGNMGKQPVI